MSIEDQTLLSCDGDSYVTVDIDTEQVMADDLPITSVTRDRLPIYCPPYSRVCIVPTLEDTTQMSDVYYAKPSCSLFDAQGNTSY